MRLPIIIILYLISCAIFCSAQSHTNKTKVLQEIESLIVADSLHRKYLQEQIKQLHQIINEEDEIGEVSYGIPVVPFNDTIFFVHHKEELSAYDRAHHIEDSIRFIVEHHLFLLDTVVITEFDDNYQLLFDGKVIHTIDSIDAKKMRSSRLKLARVRQKAINKTLHNQIYGQGKDAGIYALIGLVILFVLIFVINKVYKVLYEKVSHRKWLSYDWLKSISLFTEEDQVKLFRYLLLGVKYGLILMLIYLYLPIVGQFSPPLKDISNRLLSYVLSPINDIILSILVFLPNLMKIIITILFFVYLLKFIQLFADAVKEERIVINGFYPDWVPPTMKIIRFLLYTFMVIIIFPLLPGANSNEFKGISVFVGILLSIGSSTIITNWISGIVITYMRRFKIGDWVKAGDVIGEVVERSLFVTRLRSSKNEVITIPNSKISEAQTINYSQPIHKYKLIVHTSVTFGYEVPWRKVHQLLKEAAAKTNFLLKRDKTPFVLQKSLDDFYVTYQLNAYTRHPEKMFAIYSQLHQNIQDIFSREDIEVMSPHYRANREDNERTVPPSDQMLDDE
ncbi:mechanosensitive ion channel family protein [Flammeovirga agarivorans]|uniref:Mechanosensitive ion channel family protein n=1 Tax=Flammeovirga agarivorans TaxID=2726742 RepID=A0A7X8XUL9_9BACT|nr:mechanosensitive ion channel family protein [Flammeovirga agarivorans]NLR90483.1 mechanosensitive ion channel family protein [Flammeovirga agarivorans]